MTTTTSKVPTRAEVPEEYTWDLSQIFPDVAAWEQELSAVEARAQELAALQGTLAQGPAQLLTALTLRDEVGRRLYALYIYATHLKDSDSTNPVGQGLAERASSFAARIQAALAFIEPELLTIPAETIEAWVDATPDLHVYRYELEKLNRQRAHIRSAEVEQVMAEFSDLARTPYRTFSMLTDSDLQFPTIEDENGQPVQLSHARYGRLLESQDRRVRRDAFKGYYSAFLPFRNTLATTLGSAIRSHVIEARLRHYSSALEAALAPNEIPVEVYHNLIATVEANLPRFHRYLSVRRRLLGLDELHFYDLYVQPVPDVELTIPYHEACDLMRAAFRPLGEEYSAALEQMFSRRWIDVYENVGKRSGAYSGGSYGTPPYILLNYQDRLRDVFTLAHELGHSLHSYFTRTHQPFVYGNYTIFVAEVASTLNEALLTHYMLTNGADEALRRRLLAQQIEEIRGTIFRQTMFAAFELWMHERAERGQPLTADVLSQYYRDLVIRYHGPELQVDDELAYEWMRIPHFYYNFYVYQYATGISAALALSRQIINEGQPAIERYLRFLRSGSSRSSIDLLRDAGVDMTSPEPIQAAMDTFAGLVDQLEQLAG
ncbi:MAG: oligoendopeptidase F [Chloroflexus sp.]|uniref:oligoendopeptidase F n=1 Tax=Chloroflexus sp. TaxID=1904827 RepID=UPI001859AFE1|nr:oligoendopeptidase F [Chloroflexus sp.]GIV86539.1 MAG: oligoendopeptidase F [Chloroflexus sp.]GIV91721.1 MAG: oligoendopeptidase F [Chloroflexus sp.]